VKKYREGKLKSIFLKKRGEIDQKLYINGAIDAFLNMLQCTFCIMGQRVNFTSKNIFREKFLMKIS